VVYVLNSATGSQKYRFTVPGYMYSSIALADMDGDGKLDLVFPAQVSNYSGSLNVTHADGSALPGWPQAIPATAVSSPSRMDPVVADVDGDLHYEVLIGSALYRYDGSSFPAWPINYSQSGTGLLAQLDGTGNLEVITGHFGGWVSQARRSDTTQWFGTSYGSENALPLAIGLPDSGNSANVVLYDLNADGQQDVINTGEIIYQPVAALPIYAASGANGVAITGFPRFAQGDANGFSDIIHSTPAFADINGDGNAEMVVAAGAKLYAWRIAAASASPWPMFQRDLRNTGTSPSIGGVTMLRTPGTNQSLALGAVNASGWGDVTHYSSAGSADQQFQLDPVAAGQFRLRQYVQGSCLYVDPAAPTTVRHKSCASADASQTFKLVSLGSLGSRIFRLQHATTGLCVSINGADAGTVTTAACSSSTTQVVSVQRLSGENLALRATALAQSTYGGYAAARINDGSRSTDLGGASSWTNAHQSAADGLLPQWIQLDFGSSKSFDRVDLLTTSTYPLKNYELQFWDGSIWRHLLDVVGNTASFRSHSFPPINASKLRVICKSGPDSQPSYGRINELEVYRTE
jgi:hypothetical protein